MARAHELSALRQHRLTNTPSCAQATAAKKGVKLLLPTDVVVADKFAADANTKTVSVDAIPDGWMGLDIGPDSVKAFQAELNECKTVIWNGPMGVFEMEKARDVLAASLWLRHV